MSYLDRIRACNRLDLSDQIPFEVDGVAYGWVSRDRARVLQSHPEVFSVGDRRVSFAPGQRTPQQRSAAIAAITPDLIASGLFAHPRGEDYGAKRVWQDAPAFLIDRKLVPAFGLRSFGVHMNGYVRDGSELRLWIGTRATDRDVEPGKLDNIVAGGQPAGLTLRENLIKECAEEAAIPEAVARQARPAGPISYAYTTPGGVKADTMFCYDLELPPDLTPRNTDGEISGFELLPVAEVLAIVRDTDRFKLNVNLVIIDFAMRHGLLDPDDGVEMEQLRAGLHRRPDPDTQNFIIGTNDLGLGHRGKC
jgi:hypothetical protein